MTSNKLNLIITWSYLLCNRNLMYNVAKELQQQQQQQPRIPQQNV